MTRRRFSVLMSVLLILVFGCGDREVNVATRQLELMERAKEYNDCFFWRDFDKASLYVLPEAKPDFLAFAHGLRHGFTLEGFTIKDIQMSPTGERAAVVIMRSFIMTPSVTLQSEEFTQEWVLWNGGWYLSGPPY